MFRPKCTPRTCPEDYTTAAPKTKKQFGAMPATMDRPIDISPDDVMRPPVEFTEPKIGLFSAILQWISNIVTGTPSEDESGIEAIREANSRFFRENHGGGRGKRTKYEESLRHRNHPLRVVQYQNGQLMEFQISLPHWRPGAGVNVPSIARFGIVQQ